MTETGQRTLEALRIDAGVGPPFEQNAAADRQFDGGGGGGALRCVRADHDV